MLVGDPLGGGGVLEVSVGGLVQLLVNAAFCPQGVHSPASADWLHVCAPPDCEVREVLASAGVGIVATQGGGGGGGVMHNYAEFYATDEMQSDGRHPKNSKCVDR